MQKKISLRYVGPYFIPGVPARDLTEAEVKEFGGEEYLLETGLYEKAVSSTQQLSPGKRKKIMKEADHDRN